MITVYACFSTWGKEEEEEEEDETNMPIGQMDHKTPPGISKTASNVVSVGEFLIGTEIFYNI